MYEFATGLPGYIVEEVSVKYWDFYTKKYYANHNNDKRKVRQSPIPSNIGQYLSNAQLKTVKTMEEFGWQLYFRRRSSIQKIITIIQQIGTSQTALIEKDGTVNHQHDILIRH